MENASPLFPRGISEIRGRARTERLQPVLTLRVSVSHRSHFEYPADFLCSGDDARSFNSHLSSARLELNRRSGGSNACIAKEHRDMTKVAALSRWLPSDCAVHEAATRLEADARSSRPGSPSPATRRRLKTPRSLNPCRQHPRTESARLSRRTP